MEVQSLEEFFKKQLQVEEIVNKALTICTNNCIIDMETLLDLSTGDLEKMQFPIGIIKKIQPFLKHRCSLQEAIKIQEEVNLTQQLIEKNSHFVVKNIQKMQETVENLAQQLSQETEKLNDVQINYQKLQKLAEELLIFKKFDSSQLISEYNKIKSDLEIIKNLFQKLNLKFAKVDLNSDIVKQQSDQELLHDWSRECYPKLKDLELIYRATRDGFNTTSFHHNCDNKGATLTIAKIKKSGNIIGGVAGQSWRSVNGQQAKGSLQESCIFSLNLKKKFKCINNAFVYWWDKNYGPSFGGNDLILMQNQKSNAICQFGKNYDAENFSKEQLIGPESDYMNIELAEIEVYLIKE